MKRLFYAMCAVLLLAGCSEKTTTEDKTNPYLPIADLVIPREGATGQNVTMQGRGFTQDARISLKLNGQSSAAAARVVSVDASSLTFTVPESLEMGFYVVMLQQNNATNRIGGINIKGEKYRDEDFQLYALSGENLQIYPISVAKQLRGTTPFPGSSVSIPDSYCGFVVAQDNGKVYYSGFEPLINAGGKMAYRIGCYDLNTRVNTPVVQIDNLCAMGLIEEEFHILTSPDAKMFTLSKWNDGSPSEVKKFDLSTLGIGRLLVLDLKFVYHAPTKTIVLSGTAGTGENSAPATYSINVETGAANKNGGGTASFWFASTGEKLYGFALTLSPLTELYSTQVFRIDDPQQWMISGVGITLLEKVEKSGFMAPAYSPVSGMIYGLDDYETPGAVLSFNTATEKMESRRWVGPGVSGLFYGPKVSLDD